MSACITAILEMKWPVGDSDFFPDYIVIVLFEMKEGIRFIYGKEKERNKQYIEDTFFCGGLTI